MPDVTKQTISDEGIYDLPEAAYHADPCEIPSLSSSIAKIIGERTARHAYMAHPRLNPNYEAENRYIFDLGSAAHALILGQPERVTVLYGVKEYRSNDDKAQRDACYAAGSIPVKEADWENVEAMVKAAAAQLARHADALEAFTNGKPEQTLIWREDNGVWCRAMLDWLPHIRTTNVFYDYKSTNIDVGPDNWGRRQLFDGGNDYQAAFYRRGIRKLLGIAEPHLHFIVQENSPPFALAVHALQPQAEAEADEKVQRAIDYWAWCMKHKAWPGYSRETYFNESPPWQSLKHAERKMHAEIAHDAKIEMNATMLDWFAPDAAGRLAPPKGN